MCSFARTKLISNFFLTHSLTAGSIDADDKKTLSDRAVAGDWLIPALGLILTKVHHGRFVRLAVGVVGNIACFMIA